MRVAQAHFVPCAADKTIPAGDLLAFKRQYFLTDEADIGVQDNLIRTDIAERAGVEIAFATVVWTVGSQGQTVGVIVGVVEREQKLEVTDGRCRDVTMRLYIILMPPENNSNNF